MNEIVWQDPPPSRQNRSGAPRKWVRLLEPLMAEPKRWALIRHYDGKGTASATAPNLRKPNDVKGACIKPPGRWEFTTRQTDTGSDLYARYLGPEDEA